MTPDSEKYSCNLNMKERNLFFICGFTPAATDTIQHKQYNGHRSYIEILVTTVSSSSFEGYPLQARHKQDWGRGFILLLPQTAALPGSDAGSDVIKPASSFVIQNRQTACSMWCPMYRAHC